jgi:Uma2 family endonuclease
MEAIESLPGGATLVLPQFDWDDDERLLDDLRDRPHLRVTYDHGRLEIMSPLPEHEEYARFIDHLARAAADGLHLKLQNYGSATWRKQRLARGTEADSCYYVANASRVIGKRRFDLETDPPPDIVVEVDIPNESLSTFPIYAALSVPEIWRHDGAIQPECQAFTILEWHTALPLTSSVGLPACAAMIFRSRGRTRRSIPYRA